MKHLITLLYLFEVCAGCPEEAFPFDPHAIEERLRGMATRINERPFTRIFY